jgi:hypothetical protein
VQVVVAEVRGTQELTRVAVEVVVVVTVKLFWM